MKIVTCFIIPLLFILFTSCEKDDDVFTARGVVIADIAFSESSSAQEAQEIEVTIQKPTPCHFVSKVEQSVSGTTFIYNIVVKGQESPCITVIAQEVVSVTFEPSGTGQYTLNFLINGELFEMRTITVTD